MDDANLLQGQRWSQRDTDRFLLAYELAASTPTPLAPAVVRHWLGMIGRYGTPVCLGLAAGLLLGRRLAHRECAA